MRIISDNVNHPEHYNSGRIECIDYIIDQNFDFFRGNIVKYLSRYKHKNGVEDLKKAQWYLNKLIEVTHSQILNDTVERYNVIHSPNEIDTIDYAKDQEFNGLEVDFLLYLRGSKMLKSEHCTEYLSIASNILEKIIDSNGG